MFEEILNLPAHPLIVHGVVVMVPLLIAVAAAYAVLPFARERLAWAVVLLALAAPGAAFAAVESGEAFEERLAGRDMLPPEIATAVDAHQEFADRLLWLAVALAAVSLALVAVQVKRQRGVAAQVTGTDEGAPAPTKPGGGPLLIVFVVLAIAVLGLGAATGWYVFQTGHSGAEMVWDGS